MSSRSGMRSAKTPDTSRRTFRGRAGPTDRNLNKHQARQRKKTTRPANDAADHEETNVETHVENIKSAQHEEKQSERDDEAVVVVTRDSSQVKEDVAEGAQRLSNDGCVAAELPSSRELKHLNRRIQNVRESIQLSATAISSPSVWKQNVLNAVQNCVNECFSIFSHYSKDERDPDACRETSLAVFQLGQFALQSGPLSGAKPGYFKRCGAEVAREALAFLDSTFSDEVVRTLCFTERQVDAIRKWRISAQKAIENNKPPSKSALKKQTKSKKSR